jgi:hypothetical protein
MTSNAGSMQNLHNLQNAVQEAPTLAQEMRGTMLLFGMFGLAFALLAAALGVSALMQALVS